MSQPPGPYGGVGQPGPYGQQPGPYGQPGPARPPRNFVPAIIAGTAVVLLALGAGTWFLLRDDHSTTPPAAVSTSTAPSTAESTAPAAPTFNAEALPGGAQVADPPSAASGGHFPGSDDVALAWVQAMADGDWQGAFDLSCADVQDAAVTAADESNDPPYELGAYFFEQTLGGAGFTDGSFDSIEYSATTGLDVATFTLRLDSGEPLTLLVYVDETPAVCDFR
ncbi:MAG: hypothetical protein JWQ99_2174 [Blastococcus sp.]|nr:hypothetical protein [Blastococcus sp.]